MVSLTRIWRVIHLVAESVIGNKESVYSLQVHGNVNKDTVTSQICGYCVRVGAHCSNRTCSGMNATSSKRSVCAVLCVTRGCCSLYFPYLVKQCERHPHLILAWATQQSTPPPQPSHPVIGRGCYADAASADWRLQKLTKHPEAGAELDLQGFTRITRSLQDYKQHKVGNMKNLLLLRWVTVSCRVWPPLKEEEEEEEEEKNPCISKVSFRSVYKMVQLDVSASLLGGTCREKCFAGEKELIRLP
ncbi:PREDICTED: uncharacterized protein LOC106149769 [Chinchilla lanigera]|uniref:uncharacterized protein LOC106149769 n=1 Tax=Chinchilla lanigera TaxID=34839 RepID=UPI000696311D|nr:PREDICTED: uncharacterized protein LOC106149769 [Chinchilla lanigera]